jgi:hypothetical protein
MSERRSRERSWSPSCIRINGRRPMSSAGEMMFTEADIDSLRHRLQSIRGQDVSESVDEQPGSGAVANELRALASFIGSSPLSPEKASRAEQLIERLWLVLHGPAQH